MTTTGIRLENDYVGYLDGPNGCDVFNTLSSAINALIETIKFEDGLVAEYPKAKWSVGYRDVDSDKWVTLYSITTRKVKELIKAKMF